jgi:glycosyltransferase involved in cell wall biosynthesis
MAMGIPVIGTHNALDCVALKNGEEGFITDDTKKMIGIAISLFNDPSERRRISVNARKFVEKNYTLEATFGKLANSLQEILNT